MDFVDNSFEVGDAIDRLIISKEKSERGNYKEEHKKLNKSLMCRTHPLTTLSNGASPIIDKRLCNYVALIQNNVIHMENDVTAGSCPTDYRGFSYYRSGDFFQDHVLMKDVAVSCTLLKLEPNKSNLMSKYFFKQIKNDYEDFSKYLQTFAKKNRNSSKIKNLQEPVATEYVDKNGNICLKLRLKDVQYDIKEESAVKNFITDFFKFWHFLFPLQKKKDNGKDSYRRNCHCVHKNKCRKAKIAALEKNSKKSKNYVT